MSDIYENCWLQSNSKNAIVMAGGGGKCAYQAGALIYISECGILPNGPDYVSGYSGGALNSLLVAQNGKDNFKQSCQELEEIWSEEIDGIESVLKYKPLKIINAFFSLSIGKADPLERLINKYINENIFDTNIQLEYTATNLRTGLLEKFDQNHSEIIKSILASAAFPIAFPPVKIGEDLYTDGGISDRTPLKHPIDFGADNIIAIETDNLKKDIENVGMKNVFDLTRVIIKIMTTSNLRYDIKKCQEINEKVKLGKILDKRKVGLIAISPSENLGDTLNFKKSLNKRRIELGYEDAKKALRKLGY
jgi:NTE family protein